MKKGKRIAFIRAATGLVLLGMSASVYFMH